MQTIIYGFVNNNDGFGVSISNNLKCLVQEWKVRYKYFLFRAYGHAVHHLYRSDKIRDKSTFDHKSMSIIVSEIRNTER